MLDEIYPALLAGHAVGRWAGLAFAVAILAFSQAASAGELNIMVHGIAKADGNVRVALYANPESFRKEAFALSVLSKPAETGDMNFTFTNLTPGVYALVAYHDENANGKLDLLLGMFPTEGWGLSNNPAVLGPPKFESSRVVVLDGPPTALTINLSY